MDNKKSCLFLAAAVNTVCRRRDLAVLAGRTPGVSGGEYDGVRDVLQSKEQIFCAGYQRCH